MLFKFIILYSNKIYLKVKMIAVDLFIKKSSVLRRTIVYDVCVEILKY